MSKLEEYAGELLSVMIREVVRKYTHPLAIDTASMVGFEKYKQMQEREQEDKELISESLDMALNALKNFVDSHNMVLKTAQMSMLLPYDPNKVGYYHEQFIKELMRNGVNLECGDGVRGIGLSFSMLDSVLGKKIKEYQARFPDEIKEIMIGMVETFKEIFGRMVVTEEEAREAGIDFDRLSGSLNDQESHVSNDE
jgi:hypothetical protein